MNLLAIETSTEACSAALSVNGQVSTHYKIVSHKHTELILPMIDSLLQKASLTLCEIDVLSYGCGPGSFTGLRIAAGVIQGLAYGAKRPVLAISSLQALAQQVAHSEQAPRILVMIDARMEEVYWGYYELDVNGVMQLIGAESLSHPSEISIPHTQDFIAVGSGWGRYAEHVPPKLMQQARDLKTECLPRAEDVVFLAAQTYSHQGTLQAHQALPHYIRQQVTHTRAKG